ncbi:collagen alpha-1(I) chain-like [Rhea pennata]|uniref:collagen alpha-1(I) chain-like n=1 Tax=Rhea pennata TaxID=8795 RepID=UPI002E26DB78
MPASLASGHARTDPHLRTRAPRPLAAEGAPGSASAAPRCGPQPSLRRSPRQAGAADLEGLVTKGARFGLLPGRARSRPGALRARSPRGRAAARGTAAPGGGRSSRPGSVCERRARRSPLPGRDPRGAAAGKRFPSAAGQRRGASPPPRKVLRAGEPQRRGATGGSFPPSPAPDDGCRSQAGSSGRCSRGPCRPCESPGGAGEPGAQEPPEARQRQVRGPAARGEQGRAAARAGVAPLQSGRAERGLGALLDGEAPRVREGRGCRGGPGRSVASGPRGVTLPLCEALGRPRREPCVRFWALLVGLLESP